KGGDIRGVTRAAICQLLSVLQLLKERHVDSREVEMLRQFPSFRRRSRAFLLAGALAAVATATFVAAGTSSGARAQTVTIPFVNPDPATATVPLAKWLAKKMHNKGNLLYVGGLPGNGTTILYDEGFHKVMKQYPNIHIVNSGNANYSISTAKQLAATAIASGK